MRKSSVDWEAVEKEYRAGIRTLRQIGDEYGCSHTAIRKKAKECGWVRDLSAKIMEAAETKVSMSEVSRVVSESSKVSEKQFVEITANVVADSIINQRVDVRAARATEEELAIQLSSIVSNREDFQRLGEMMANPDDKGNDRLRDTYTAVISLSENIKNLKLLMEARRMRIELERKILRIDEKVDDPVESAARGAAQGAAQGSSEATQSMLSGILDELRNASPSA